MFIILSPPSLALSLKILPISKLSIRGTVSSYLICYYLSLMPLFIASVYYTALIAFILSVSVVMPSCSCCVEKGLVYITIMALPSRQPLSYAKCTKANIYLSYNICSVSAAKYMCCLTLLNCLVPCLGYCRALDLIRH